TRCPGRSSRAPRRTGRSSHGTRGRLRAEPAGAVTPRRERTGLGALRQAHSAASGWRRDLQGWSEQVSGLSAERAEGAPDPQVVQREQVSGASGGAGGRRTLQMERQVSGPQAERRAGAGTPTGGERTGLGPSRSGMRRAPSTPSSE
ncbi:unnamed protein product, partial [Staurois parvus]